MSKRRRCTTRTLEVQVMMSGMLHEVEREEQTGDQGDVDERDEEGMKT